MCFFAARVNFTCKLFLAIAYILFHDSKVTRDFFLKHQRLFFYDIRALKLVTVYHGLTSNEKKNK